MSTELVLTAKDYNRRCLSVLPSVCLKLKISVTAEPIGLYFFGNIPTGPVVVLGYFLKGKYLKKTFVLDKVVLHISDIRGYDNGR